MRRVKRRISTQIRRKKILSLRKRISELNFHLFRIAKQRIMRAFTFSFCMRRVQKRYFRSLCIIRIRSVVRYYAAFLQPCDTNYNSFLYRLRQTKCLLNRKVVIQIALTDILFFQKICILRTKTNQFSYLLYRIIS